MRRHAEPGRNLLRAETALLRELLECLELVGGMHVFPGDVFVKADLVRVVGSIDDTADRLGLLDLLALDPQKLGKPPALTDGDGIEAGSRTVTIPIPVRRPDFAKWPLAAMLGRIASIAASLCGVLRAFFGDFLSLLSGMKISVPLSTMVSACLADMIDLLWVKGAERTCACAPARRRDRG